mmetsp:Transcript_15004/g.61127  ORF Transcript_15004/g.61127 Transcript_15004/m.61127 type:complete len:169 (+) Transcript_15004:227-733(+)
MSVRMKAMNKESPQILGLRKEVKEKGLEVGKLKEKMRDLKELALAEDTTAKAFEAFRAGPEAFAKEIKREIVPDIATGKISDAKSSLYTEKVRTFEPKMHSSPSLIPSCSYVSSDLSCSLIRLHENSKCRIWRTIAASETFLKRMEPRSRSMGSRLQQSKKSRLEKSR